MNETRPRPTPSTRTRPRPTPSTRTRPRPTPSTETRPRPAPSTETRPRPAPSTGIEQFPLSFTRAEMASDRRLVGAAAVFDSPTNKVGFWEQLAAGSLDRVLRAESTDVRALWNHDPTLLLGRQQSGTLRLRATATELEFEVDLPDTSYAQDLAVLVKRGDLDGGSIAFRPGQTERRQVGGRRILTHTDIADARDVSVVTWPAYDQTHTALRAELAVDRQTSLVLARARVARAGRPLT